MHCIIYHYYYIMYVCMYMYLHKLNRVVTQVLQNNLHPSHESIPLHLVPEDHIQSARLAVLHLVRHDAQAARRVQQASLAQRRGLHSPPHFRNVL